MSDSACKRGPLKGGPKGWILRAAAVFALVYGGSWLIYAQGTPAPAQASEASIWILPFIFLCLLIGSAFGSSAETALFSLDKLDTSQLRNSSSWTDRQILKLLDRPNDTLVTILILNNFFNIGASLTAATFMEKVFQGTSAWTITLAAVVATTGILLLGEILPKVIAHLNPQRAARFLAPPLAAFAWIMTPLRFVLGLLLKGMLGLLKVPEQNSGEEVSEEELKVMISSGEVSSVLEDDEREMIDGVFELRRTVAAEILTPRMSVTAVPDHLTQEEMVARLRQSPNNRVLVYHETLDQLLGFVLVKEVLLDEQGVWRDHLREALMVPEGVGLLDLLKTFRKQRTKMAIVVDEYGGVAGIVTLQDLLEEIVGDIYEKHEHDELEIRELEDGLWRVAGSVNLERLGEVCGVEFPSDKGRTAGGFVMNTLGRIPKAGDEVFFDSLELKVERMAGRRLHSLIVRRLPVAEPASAGEGRE